MTDLSDRLDRIDVKLDKLSEAVSQLARIEERISHQTESGSSTFSVDFFMKYLREFHFFLSHQK